VKNEKYQTEEIREAIENNPQTEQYPACQTCLCGLAVQMFGKMNGHPEAVIEGLRKGDPPAELLKRIFAAKIRQMDFYYGEKVAERLKKAGDSNPELIPSFLNEKPERRESFFYDESQFRSFFYPRKP
jgi:hypothetical protein